MGECDEMVGAVIEVRVGKSGDDSNLYTLHSKQWNKTTWNPAYRT